MSKNIYKTVINEIFREHYIPGIDQFEFTRADLEAVGVKLGLDPKNLGDVIYAYRLRRPLPKEIRETLYASPCRPNFCSRFTKLQNSGVSFRVHCIII